MTQQTERDALIAGLRLQAGLWANVGDGKAGAVFTTTADMIEAQAQRIAELENSLADAVDCKNGTGPTALAMVISDRDTLRAELEALRGQELTGPESCDYDRCRTHGCDGVCMTPAAPVAPAQPAQGMNAELLAAAEYFKNVQGYVRCYTSWNGMDETDAIAAITNAKAAQQKES